MTGSVQKKGTSYYLVFRVFDPATGQRRQKWVPAGQSKRDAERKLSELMTEVHGGAYRPLQKATFTEFAKLWLTSYAKTRTKPSTLKSYEVIIRVNLRPAFGGFLLTEISPAMIQQYIAKRLEKVKSKTVVNELVPLKEMLKHAVRWGYLKLNPAVEIERPRVEREEMEYLRPNEIRCFLEHVSSHYRTFFLMAILTGMRRGELIALQWGDFDWNVGQLWIRRSIWRKQFVTPKSKLSVRRIDMTPRLLLELKRQRLACTPGLLDLVFPGPQGEPLDPDALVKRQFLPALRRAGLRHVPFHALRHTNVALRIAQGQPIKYIQHQLGHASIQTTLDRYGHLMPETQTEQAKKLDFVLALPIEDDTSSIAINQQHTA